MLTDLMTANTEDQSSMSLNYPDGPSIWEPDDSLDADDGDYTATCTDDHFYVVKVKRELDTQYLAVEDNEVVLLHEEYVFDTSELDFALTLLLWDYKPIAAFDELVITRV